MEAVLRLFLDEHKLDATHTTYALLTAQPPALRGWAEELKARIGALDPVRSGALAVDIVEVSDAVGAGSLPTVELPGVALRLQAAGVEAGELAKRLRAADVPVFTTVQDRGVHVHVRTLLPGDDADVAQAIASAF
ncbi:MAG: hypothetical protein ACYTG6_17405, partial [Planctomycetota bacterium]|jgi:L-seryl-tRNA(Ser) seleniumtransferase